MECACPSPKSCSLGKPSPATPAMAVGEWRGQSRECPCHKETYRHPCHQPPHPTWCGASILPTALLVSRSCQEKQSLSSCPSVTERLMASVSIKEVGMGVPMVLLRTGDIPRTAGLCGSSTLCSQTQAVGAAPRVSQDKK